MIHELKIDLEDPKGVRYQLNLRDYASGFNGSVQVRFSPKQRFTVSCLGRQNTIIFHLGDRQVALPLEELPELLGKLFDARSQDDDAGDKPAIP